MQYIPSFSSFLEPTLAAMTRNSDPIFCTILLQFIEICSICLCTALLRSHRCFFNFVEVWTLMDHCSTLIIFFFRLSFPDSLLRSSSCFQPSFSCQIWLIASHLTPKDIVPEVLWFHQMQLCKPKPCYHILFKEKRLSSGNPSKQAILAHSFSNCTVMNFNI